MHRLLVVDDEADICQLLKEGFEAKGNYRVSCAVTGAEALAALRRERFDLALVDILLHQNAGPEIEALAARRSVPVLRMSGHPELIQKSRDAGMPVITKPFRLSDLTAKVGLLLSEAWRLQRALEKQTRAKLLLSRRWRPMRKGAPQAPWETLSVHWLALCRRVLNQEAR